MKKLIALIFVLLLVFMLIFQACKDEELPTIENALTNKMELTLTQNSINGSSADLTCSVTNPDKNIISELGLCWNTSGNPTTNDFKTEAEALSNTSFNIIIDNLNHSTVYYVKAYVIIKGVTIYSEQTKITTTDGLPNGLVTTAISDITITTATSGGNIISDGGVSITARGVCWSPSPNPTISDSQTIDGFGTGEYISNITGLTANTTYYVRAYATNSVGTAYANEVNFLSGVTSIGATYAGGIVFYIDGTGQHGLVCAPFDQIANAEWGCYGTEILGADGTAVGTGNQNTIDIVNGCSTAGIAARICYDLVLNGYNDWFLPSMDELNLMYTNLKTAGIGDFADNYYWSSSEYDSSHAWVMRSNDNPLIITLKGYSLPIRAARAF